MKHWIVGVTKPNSEAIAEENLKRQGFEYFCPRFEERRPNKAPRIRPLFSRYIFIRIEQLWYSIMGTRGISSVLLGDNGPGSVPDSLIEDLYRRMGKQGLVTLEPVPKFAQGTVVKTSSGPFTGHLLIYDNMTGRDRVRVLMEALGRKVSIELPESSLVAA